MEVFLYKPNLIATLARLLLDTYLCSALLTLLQGTNLELVILRAAQPNRSKGIRTCAGFVGYGVISLFF